MPKKRFRFLNNSGVTLVELAIATTIFAIAITPLFIMLNRTLKDVLFYNRTTVATRLAQDLIEEILNMPKWDEQSPSGKAIPFAGATAPGSLGPDAAEVYPNFDDIDDYHGFNDNAEAGSHTPYYRSVGVEYVNIPNGASVNVTTSPGLRTNFKRIRVRIIWDKIAETGKNPVDISAIAANINKY